MSGTLSLARIQECMCLCHSEFGTGQSPPGICQVCGSDTSRFCRLQHLLHPFYTGRHPGQAFLSLLLDICLLRTTLGLSGNGQTQWSNWCTEVHLTCTTQDLGCGRPLIDFHHCEFTDHFTWHPNETPGKRIDNGTTVLEHRLAIAHFEHRITITHFNALR